MRQVKVGSTSEFADPGRKIIAFERIEVGVFNWTVSFSLTSTSVRMRADLPARVR